MSSDPSPQQSPVQIVRGLSLRKARKVVDAFRMSGATSADAALRFSEVPLPDHAYVERLVEDRVLCEAAEDHYWLDEGEWSQYRDSQRGKLILATVFGALFLWGTYVTVQVFLTMV